MGKINKVAILVGGLGVRLRPITEKVPKPMVEVKGKPFLEYKINHIKKYGIKDIVLCVGYLGHIVEEYFKDGSKFGVKIKYSKDDMLGTGGSIKNAESLLDEEFLVMNGDTFVEFDINEMIKFHNTDPSTPTMLVTDAQNPKEQSLVKLNGNLIGSFLNVGSKEHDNELKNSKKLLVHAGAHIINKKILKDIPSNKKVSIESEIFPKLAGKMKAFYYKGYIKDIANENILNQFREEIKNLR